MPIDSVSTLNNKLKSLLNLIQKTFLLLEQLIFD